MPPSYNIDQLPFDSDAPVPEMSKEYRENLLETRSIVSTAASSVAPSTVFRGKPILVVGLGVALSIALILVGLFVHIFVTHEYAQNGGYIFTAASLGSTLAIAHALGAAILLTLPVVSGLHSYRLAWHWLKASADTGHDTGHDRPTPFQLGVIMNLLNGANLPAFWGGMRYMYGIGSTKRSAYRPPILRRAMFVLALTLFVSHAYVVLDIALSAASQATSFTQLNAYDGAWPQLSRQINSSMCATSDGAVAAGINLCGLEVPGDAPFSGSLPEALRTLTNNSETNAVAFGNDGTAFIVPASIPGDVAFLGSSYGVLSSCQSITPECVGQGPYEGQLNLSCPATAFFNAAFDATTNQYPFGILDLNGQVYPIPYEVSTNPFNFGGVVSSQAYSADDDTFVGNTGFFAHSGIDYNVLTCSVTVLEVSYAYFNGTFTIDPWNTTASTNLDIVHALGAMTTAAFLQERVPAAIDGATEDYAAAFGRELSRELIAFTAALYEPAPPQEVQRVKAVLGTRIPLAVLVLMLVLVVGYCVLILLLTCTAAAASSASPYTLLARARLSSPLTAIHAAYARCEAHRTWESTSARLFSTETGLDRLCVGPTTTSAGGLAFGVTRAVVAPSA
ncbi:hypothetical protein FB45DRAFT_941078 [Roridomyces roridus]|uniref:Uncharacterized protein n=1 Tax=Roridomyces roridus TaxID=1738132 RepID=A0AAD7B6T0_9AGAR|nr:hypothetical protein FB45DRAFT_941078 [Roridomyces roridus]